MGNCTLTADTQRFVSAFPWRRITFRVVVASPMDVEQYIGGMIRGALGWELQEAFCRRPEGKLCGRENCATPASCVFAALWAPPARPDLRYGSGTQAPSPVIVEAPPLGRLKLATQEELSFSVVLVGSALTQQSTVIAAVINAGRRGLGNRRVRYQVASTNTVGSSNSSGALPRVPAGGVQLLIESPLRLRYQGKDIDQAPVPATAFVRALCRRLGMLADYHAPTLPQPDWKTLAALANDVPPLRGEVSWLSWQRRSLRQRRTMALSGLVGELAWPRVPPPVRPLLALGSVVHIGKSASTGIGRYRIAPLWNDTPGLLHGG